MRWRAETQIHLLLQESVQTLCFFGPWNCFSHLVKTVQPWCFPSYFFSESHVGISACSKASLSSQFQPYKGSPETETSSLYFIHTCTFIPVFWSVTQGLQALIEQRCLYSFEWAAIIWGLALPMLPRGWCWHNHSIWILTSQQILINGSHTFQEL